MNDIQRVLKRAAWRMGVASYLHWLVLLISAGLVGAILVRLAQLAAAFEINWLPVAYWSAGAAVVLAGLAAYVTRANAKRVAMRVDEGANLKEAISTALYVEKSDDPWSRATVASAADAARRVEVRQAVPIEAPRAWPVPVALSLAFAVLMILSPWDLFGRQEVKVAEEKKKEAVVQAVKHTKEAEQKLDELAKKLGLEEQKLPEPSEPDKPEPRDPDAIRKMMIKEIAKKQEQIEEIRSGEKGAKFDTLKEAMKQLKAPGKELMPLTRAMAQGNFEQAQAELQKLKEQMASGNMTPEQKEAVSKQMDSLAKQMERLGENSKNLEKKLSEAGLDPALAKNPDALKEALKNAQNLSEQQKEQMEQAAQAQSQASQACQSMAQAMSNMAKAGQQGEQAQQQGQEGAQQMESQLSELEMLAQEMQACEAGMAECQGMMSELAGKCEGGNQGGQGEGECNGGQGEGDNPGTGSWKEGWSEAQGTGSGGPGQGSGAAPGEAKAAYTTEMKKAIGNMGDGPTIGTTMVEGEQIRGESVAKFEATATAAGQAASEAIENNVYPREYHASIKRYFGTLEKKAKGQPRTAEVKKGDKADAPAEPAAEEKK